MRSFYPAPQGPLPPRQQQVFDFICSAMDGGKPFPSLEEIAQHMGWKSQGSALDCLYRLQWRGMVERFDLLGATKSKSRPALRYGWKVTPNAGVTAPKGPADGTSP